MEHVQYGPSPEASTLEDDRCRTFFCGCAIRARYSSRAQSGMIGPRADVCPDPASTYVSRILRVQRLTSSAHSFATAWRNTDFLSASHLKSSLSHSISTSILSQVVLSQPTSFLTRQFIAYKHAVRSSICSEHLSFAVKPDVGAGLTEEDREAHVARARSVQNPLMFGTRAWRWCGVSANGSLLPRNSLGSSIIRKADNVMLGLLAKRRKLKRFQGFQINEKRR